MRGTMRWFSKEKRYGLVTGEDGLDRYIYIGDVIDKDLPREGDIVEFKPSDLGERKNQFPIAERVKVVERSGMPQQPKPVEEHKCAECGRMVTPTVVYVDRMPDELRCPYCEATIRQYGFTTFHKTLGLIVLIVGCALLVSMCNYW